MPSFCLRWPESPVAIPGGPLPDVPALLLNGRWDSLTPMETSDGIAALLPRAVRLNVANLGHGVTVLPCARRALARFMTDRSIARACARNDAFLPVSGIAPRRFAGVPAASGTRGRVGRTLGAVAATLRDLPVAVMLGTPTREQVRFGGLRAGRGTFGFRRGRVRLDRLSYVPGVELSGAGVAPGLTARRMRIVVSGPAAAHGSLTLRGRALRGRLGGRRVRATITSAAGDRPAAHTDAERACGASRANPIFEPFLALSPGHGFGIGSRAASTKGSRDDCST
jgi:hypothetical protein